MYVDIDNAGDTVTHRSRTGFIIFLNSAPIYWSSKKQATEYVRGLQYKLIMMGIPVEEPALIFGDNQSVLANTTIPESKLKKKTQSIAYHFVQEGSSRDE